MVNRDLLGRMQPHAVLVNVSRGAVIDTPAIIDALRSQKIGGAALDVFDVQPLPPDDALFDCPNLLLTPHTAGITATSSRAMAVGSAEEMLRILRGEAAAQSRQSRLQGSLRFHQCASHRSRPFRSPTSVPEGQNVRLGIGRAVKRDAVLVKVTTDEGLVGWGEAHHGRCPGAIAKLIDTTISRTRRSAWTP